LELQKKRQDLIRRFSTHNDQTQLLFPAIVGSTRFSRMPIREPCRCQEDEVCGHLGLDVDPFDMDPGAESGQARVPLPRAGSGAVERLEVPLPSSAIPPRVFDRSTCAKEMKLRVAQAEEALQAIRKEVGYKSFLFKARKQLLHTKETRTRSYKAVADADSEIRRHTRLYNAARASLLALSNDSVFLSKFQPLTKSDLKPLPSIYGPNDAGGTRTAVSWIWSAKLGLDQSSDSPYMIESQSSSSLSYIQP
jgi:hypothetical protein